jgi:uncharacterized membrane protein
MADEARGRRWSDEQVEMWIGGMLRWGVLVAAAVALVGVVFHLATAGRARADYSSFHPVPHGLDTVGGVVSSALALKPAGVGQLGLLLLIATPILRVALSLVAFALQRDRTYVVITSIVLALLLYGLLGPGVG